MNVEVMELAAAYQAALRKLDKIKSEPGAYWHGEPGGEVLEAEYEANGCARAVADAVLESL